MPRKICKPEEISAKLRQVEVLTSRGRPATDATRSIGVTDLDGRLSRCTWILNCPARSVDRLRAVHDGAIGDERLATSRWPQESSNNEAQKRRADDNRSFLIASMSVAE
jgi:hypothetical protein